MNSLDIKIMAIPERREQAEQLRKMLALAGEDVIWGATDGSSPPLVTAKHAWTVDIPEGVTHRLVLQDDVQLCDHFEQIMQQIIDTHPDKLVTLFPIEYMGQNKWIDAGLHSPYLVARMVSGCGIIMPTSWITQLWAWVNETQCESYSDTAAIHRWAAEHGKQMITTIPATIQHTGDVSYATQGADIRRTVYYQQTPVGADWTSPDVLLVKRCGKTNYAKGGDSDAENLTGKPGSGVGWFVQRLAQKG